jgi:hypothetical protein
MGEGYRYLYLPAEIKPTPDQTGPCRIDRDFGNHQQSATTSTLPLASR